MWSDAALGKQFSLVVVISRQLRAIFLYAQMLVERWPAKMRARSPVVSSRHWPGMMPPRSNSPMRTRMRRNVGWPMAAVMRRTW